MKVTINFWRKDTETPIHTSTMSLLSHYREALVNAAQHFEAGYECDVRLVCLSMGEAMIEMGEFVRIDDKYGLTITQQ